MLDSLAELSNIAGAVNENFKWFPIKNLKSIFMAAEPVTRWSFVKNFLENFSETIGKYMH